MGGGGLDRGSYWRTFDNSVSAVSFGFVATAILISMFLIMAIFERFLWRRSPGDGGGDPAAGDGSVTKLDYPSPKMTIYPKGVSVLMPGDTIPTFLAHPAPAGVAPPSTSESVSRPIPHQSMFPGPDSTR
ncbi:hypothetical protein PHJA_001834100 [Phtheirospermum japonicum]|uniref:Uncharacterized protein n=1 Tax=Phtheirospermum japonicum TaxID=374723 RepID=A0A830CBA8_9LAMI|nr:hypothetical protein PHJA_001834100 [Phtheirospermum japonicum]